MTPEQILARLDEVKPKVLVLDSVQTLHNPELDGVPGSISQVREVASQAMAWAKGRDIATFLVGHVTKEGNLAGPRTLRDTGGFVVDTFADPVQWGVNDVRVRNSAYAVRFIDVRASLLPADKVVEEAALDKYAYIRDAYLQRRRSQVFDGNPPRLPEE